MLTISTETSLCNSPSHTTAMEVAMNVASQKLILIVPFILLMSPTLFPFNCSADANAFGSLSSSSSLSSSARVRAAKKTTVNASTRKIFIFSVGKFLFDRICRRNMRSKDGKISLQLKAKLTFSVLTFLWYDWKAAKLSS